MSTVQQRQKIGFFRKLNGIDEDTYRDMLLAYGVSTSKDLDGGQAERIIQLFKELAMKSGKYKPKKEFAFNKNRYHDCDGRAGMATAKQLRKIEAMWFSVSRQGSDLDRRTALNKYIKRIAGKDNIRFLTASDVKKVIKALENTEK